MIGAFVDVGERSLAEPSAALESTSAVATLLAPN
jgi:hypothetical protein